MIEQIFTDPIAQPVVDIEDRPREWLLLLPDLLMALGRPDVGFLENTWMTNDDRVSRQAHRPRLTAFDPREWS